MRHGKLSAESFMILPLAGYMQGLSPVYRGKNAYAYARIGSAVGFEADDGKPAILIAECYIGDDSLERFHVMSGPHEIKKGEATLRPSYRHYDSFLHDLSAPVRPATTVFYDDSNVCVFFVYAC
jgi:hypothetical protein